jgi:hypothetical protein
LTQDTRHSDPTATPDEILTSVSEGMVGLLKEFYGRGPTGAGS